MPGRKGRKLIENSSNIIKCWFKCAFKSKLLRHFKKDGGLLNYVGLESTLTTPKRGGLFSRKIVGNSANDLSPLKYYQGNRI